MQQTAASLSENAGFSDSASSVSPNRRRGLPMAAIGSPAETDEDDEFEEETLEMLKARHERERDAMEQKIAQMRLALEVNQKQDQDRYDSWVAVFFSLIRLVRT